MINGSNKPRGGFSEVSQVDLSASVLTWLKTKTLPRQVSTGDLRLCSQHKKFVTSLVLEGRRPQSNDAENALKQKWNYLHQSGSR